MKLFFSAVLVFFASLCFAQNQNVYYYKNNGDTVSTKDSADFIRKVGEQDAATKLFPVTDYYLDGTLKLKGKTTTALSGRFEGPRVEYFKNGKQRSAANYRRGFIIGDSYTYYPNGKIYMHEKYPNIKSQQKEEYFEFQYLREVYDSLGTVMFSSGNGHFTRYDDDFTESIEDGDIKNNKRTGTWRGSVKKTNIAFEEQYVDGMLISGIFTQNGKTGSYSGQRVVQPKFPGDDNAFNWYLARKIHYPAVERERGIQGRVSISFYVNADGSVTDVKMREGLSPGIDSEAIRAVQASPRWIPGTEFGIPVRMNYVVPLAFALDTKNY